MVSSARALSAFWASFCRREVRDFVVHGLPGRPGLAGRQVRGSDALVGPEAMLDRFDGPPEQLAGLLRFRAVLGQDAVEQHDLGGQFLDGAVLGVVGPLGGGDQQAEHDGGERRHRPHPQLHDVFRVRAQVMLGQETLEEHRDQCDAEDAREHDGAGRQRTHDIRLIRALSGVAGGPCEPPAVKGHCGYWLGPLLAASASCILFAISALMASRLKLAPRCIGG